VRFPAIDNTIVTGSSRIISTLVRQGLTFDGPVITDDLTMNGAAELGEMGERTVAAFKAGHDILLLGQDLETIMIAFDYFRNAVERGEIPKEQLQASLSRVSAAKYKFSGTIAL
jgi:beta-N-acetylhexosaminidase